MLRQLFEKKEAVYHKRSIRNNQHALDSLEDQILMKKKKTTRTYFFHKLNVQK